MGPDHFYFPEAFEHWTRRTLPERLQITAAFVSSFDRRRREYKRIGWVYAMRNPTIKSSVFKVGLSSRFPYERARELTRGTGVLGEFHPVYFVHVGDRSAAEAEAHQMLAEHRVSSSKEFFSAPLGQILTALDTVAGRYPVWAGPKRDPKPLAQPFLPMPRLPIEDLGAGAPRDGAGEVSALWAGADRGVRSRAHRADAALLADAAPARLPFLVSGRRPRLLPALP